MSNNIPFIQVQSATPPRPRTPTPPWRLPPSMDDFRILGQEPNYEPVLGSGWKAKRLLGRGTNGVVGLWEYEGEETKTVKQIAIKQSHTYRKEPMLESNFMEVLNEAKSIHIVRQYREATLQSTGVGNVVTMFLEFCPNGDVSSLSRNHGKQPGVLEIDLWDLFYCLACAGAVLERGTEDIDSEPVVFAESDEVLVHCDLKPDNVFMGRRDPNHKRYPVLKLGDFGNAKLEPKFPADPNVWREPRNRGASGYKAPEDAEGHLLKGPRKGSCTNVFQLGCIMYDIIQRDHKYPASEPKKLWQGPYTKPDHIGKYTLGAELFSEPWKRCYSRNLRELIMECMMWEPDDRPSALELQKRIIEGRNVAWDIGGPQAKMYFDHGGFATVLTFEEPIGSGLWEEF